MRQAVRVLLIVWTAVMLPAPSFAQTPQSSAPAPAVSAVHPIEKSAAALKVQLDEMKRSEDRLLQVVLAALGMVAVAALGLAAFSWWNAKTLYERDLEKVKDELLEQLRSGLKTDLGEIDRKVAEGQRRMHDKVQAEGVAHTLGFIAELRLKLGDPRGSIGAALEQYSAAKVGNTNYMAHAITALIAAFRLVDEQHSKVDSSLIQDARRVLADYRHPDDANVKQLNAILNRIDPLHGS